MRPISNIMLTKKSISLPLLLGLNLAGCSPHPSGRALAVALGAVSWVCLVHDGLPRQLHLYGDGAGIEKGTRSVERSGGFCLFPVTPRHGTSRGSGVEYADGRGTV